MDIIKKRINLEAYKNHTPAFFPYIKVYNDGKWREKSGKTTDAVVIPTGGGSNSWGNILCNMTDLSGTTADLLLKYYEINSILETGIKMKRMVSDSGAVVYVVSFYDQVKSYNYEVSNIEYLKAIKPGVYELIDSNVEGDFVVFLSNEHYERYTEIGGDDFISYVEENILGLIKVEFAKGSVHEGENIEGDLVPDKFYISAIQKWLKWFEENIPGKDNECNCYDSEWVKRGGDKMISFLQENEYRLSKFKNIPEISIPTISVPVFLSQNYDDNGVMSVYDESTPYNKSKDAGRVPYEENYSTPYTVEGGVRSESKLDSLKSNIKTFDDNGNILPFIYDDGKAYLPYRIGEGFNVLYDTESGEYVADYIKDIKILDKNGQALNNEHPDGQQLDINGVIEFEYVIGETYNQEKQNISIKNNIESVNSEIGAYNNAITIVAKKPWVILSNNSSFSVSPSNGVAGTYNLRLQVKEKNVSTTDDKLLTIVAATRGKIHDEVMCTITQKCGAPADVCSFDSSLPTIISLGSEFKRLITVRCNGSGWYLKSKPSFIEVNPITGKENTSVSVTLICEPLPDGVTMREGNFEFVATDNQNVTYKPIVRQGIDIPVAFIATIFGGPTIEYGKKKQVVGYMTSGGTTTSFNIGEEWGYSILDRLYANNIIVEYGDIGMTFTNNNIMSSTINVRVQIYNKKIPSLSAIVTVTLINNLTISITPAKNQTLSPFDERTFTVTVNGDNSDNWTPYVTGAGAGNVSINKTAYNTFKVTNENNGNISKVVVVGAKSTTRENVTSNEVSVLLKNK